MKTGQAGQCERPRGTERGSRLLKGKDAATCRIDQNVLLSTPIFLPCS